MSFLELECFGPFSLPLYRLKQLKQVKVKGWVNYNINSEKSHIHAPADILHCQKKKMQKWKF